MEWPKNLTDPSYEPMVLGAVADGNYEHVFVPITIEAGGHTGVFRVSQDALKIDGVRVNVSATLQQHIADLLDASLLTPKLLDQMWAQRSVTLTPCNMGKTWVVTNDLLKHRGMACNMGWHHRGMACNMGWHLEKPGYAHSPLHIDYRQICLLVSKNCVVDGRLTRFDEVAQTLALAKLVNADGVLRVLRQPGSPELVKSPVATAVPLDRTTIALTGIGVGLGAAVAGPPGAVVGGAAGLAIDAVRRRLLA